MEKRVRLYQCLSCKKIDAAKLPCGHEYCKNCIVSSMKKKSVSKIYEDLECPQCSSLIYFEFLLAFYMDDQELMDVVEMLRKCDYCQNSNTDLVILDCEHRYCKFCLYTRADEFIKAQNVFTNINCFLCKAYIRPSLFRNYIEPAEFNKLFKLKKIKNLKSLSIVCIGCNKRQNNIDIKDFKFTCKSCKKFYCIACDRDPHQQDCNIPSAIKAPKSIKKQVIPKPNPSIPPKPSENESSLLKKMICVVCKKKQGKTLECFHSYCEDCFRSHIRACLEKDLFSDIACICGKTIPYPDIIQSFGSKQAYEKFKEFQAEQKFFVPEAAKFTCGICTNSIEVEGSITLECDHRFCEACAKSYFEERITSSNVAENELVCPECNNPVDSRIIQGIMPRDLYEKYVNFAFRNWRPEDGNILKYCHLCNTGAEIPVDLKRFNCPGCGKSYCPQCNQDHLENVTCEDAAREKERKEQQVEEIQGFEDVQPAPVQHENWDQMQGGNQVIIGVPRGWANFRFHPGFRRGNVIHGHRMLEEQMRIEEINRNEENRRRNEENRRNEERVKADAERKRKEEAKKNANKPDPNKGGKPGPGRNKSQGKGPAKPSSKEEKKKMEDLNIQFIMQNSKLCPKCKQPIEKESGCNFIKCRWPGCKETYFCFLCLSVLTIRHHYSHYQISGPFGKTCNKLDGIRD